MEGSGLITSGSWEMHGIQFRGWGGRVERGGRGAVVHKASPRREKLGSRLGVATYFGHGSNDRRGGQERWGEKPTMRVLSNGRGHPQKNAERKNREKGGEGREYRELGIVRTNLKRT